MPVLPGNKNFITSEETEFEAPASEATMQRIGEAINFNHDIIDSILSTITSPIQVFNLSGSWNAPANCTRVLVIAVGGGGGGGGSRNANSTTAAQSGQEGGATTFNGQTVAFGGRGGIRGANLGFNGSNGAGVDGGQSPTEGNAGASAPLGARGMTFSGTTRGSGGNGGAGPTALGWGGGGGHGRLGFRLFSVSPSTSYNFITGQGGAGGSGSGLNSQNGEPGERGAIMLIPLR